MNEHAQRLAEQIGGPTKYILLGEYDHTKTIHGSHRRGMENLFNLGLIDMRGNPTKLGEEVRDLVKKRQDQAPEA